MLVSVIKCSILFIFVFRKVVWKTNQLVPAYRFIDLLAIFDTWGLEISVFCVFDPFLIILIFLIRFIQVKIIQFQHLEISEGQFTILVQSEISIIGCTIIDRQIHCSQRMNPIDFVYPVVFLLDTP